MLFVETHLKYSWDIFGFSAYNITLGNWSHMKYFAVKKNKSLAFTIKKNLL